MKNAIITTFVWCMMTLLCGANLYFDIARMLYNIPVYIPAWTPAWLANPITGTVMWSIASIMMMTCAIYSTVLICRKEGV